MYLKRPISPHITIYKLQISSVLSILHRISGLVTFCSVSLIVWLLIFWIFSKFDNMYIKLISNRWMIFLWFLTSWTWIFHLCNGIRYLIWSCGMCFSIKAIDISGITSFIASVLFTILLWLWIFYSYG